MYYLCFMAKIIIDTSEYCTQAEYSRLTGIKLGTISQWVKRAIEGKGTVKIEYYTIPELNITLVKRP